jgi:hypothetical protein
MRPSSAAYSCRSALAVALSRTCDRLRWGRHRRRCPAAAVLFYWRDGRWPQWASFEEVEVEPGEGVGEVRCFRSGAG